MRFISTRIHGLMDYPVALLLLAAPFLFGFDESLAATWTSVGVGVVMLMMSVFTDYELGAVRSIPMGTHLMMDVVAGAFLAASPWLLGFASVVWVPHLVIGLLEVGTAMMTETLPSDERTGRHAHVLGHR